MKSRKCKLCRYQQVYIYGFRLEAPKQKLKICLNSKSLYVTERGWQDYKKCKTMRMSGESCGPDAKLWEKKNEQD